MQQQPTYSQYTKVAPNRTWAILFAVVSLHLVAAWWVSFTPIKILKTPNTPQNIRIQFIQPKPAPPKKPAANTNAAQPQPAPKTATKAAPKKKAVSITPKPKPVNPKPKAKPKTKPRVEPKPKPQPSPKKLVTSTENSTAKQRDIAMQHELEKQQKAEQQREQERQQKQAQEAARLAKEAEQARLAQERAAAKAAAAKAQQAADAAKKAAFNNAMTAAKGKTVNASYKHQAKPKYPRKEEMRGQDGKVSFRFVIGTDGKAKDIEVIEATSNSFRRAATKALQASTFHVTKVQGVAIEQKARTSIEFALE